MDDILCLYNGTDRQLNSLLNTLNSIEPSIKFTIETEVDKSINFLDLTIEHINKNNFNFQIYRKPTYTDTIIPSTSNHPFSTKMAAFHSMLHRLISIPLDTQNFKYELNIITKIAENNGYNKNIIHDLLHKKQKKVLYKQLYNSSPIPEKDKIIYRKLKYVKNTSNSLSIELKKFNIITGLYNSYNLRNCLINNKIVDREPFSHSGIYQINCESCNFIYIGQTRRNFNIRFKEHMSSFKNNKTNSNVAKHLNDFGHTCTISNLNIRSWKF